MSTYTLHLYKSIYVECSWCEVDFRDWSKWKLSTRDTHF